MLTEICTKISQSQYVAASLCTVSRWVDKISVNYFRVYPPCVSRTLGATMGIHWVPFCACFIKSGHQPSIDSVCAASCIIFPACYKFLKVWYEKAPRGQSKNRCTLPVKNQQHWNLDVTKIVTGCLSYKEKYFSIDVKFCQWHKLRYVQSIMPAIAVASAVSNYEPLQIVKDGPFSPNFFSITELWRDHITHSWSLLSHPFSCQTDSLCKKPSIFYWLVVFISKTEIRVNQSQ